MIKSIRTLPIALTMVYGLLLSCVAMAGPIPLHGLALHDVLYGNWTGLPDQSDPEFGKSVAMDDEWLAVGAPGTMVDRGQYGTKRHGTAFLFHRENGVWQYKQRIFAGGYGDSACGFSVGLDVPWLIVGCPGADNVSPSTGAGVVNWYHLAESGAWSFAYGWNELSGARCGMDVSISDGHLGDAILAYGCPAWNGGQGYIRIWRHHADTDTWSNIKTVSALDGAAGDNFGSSVSLTEDYNGFLSPNFWLAVGAPNNDLSGRVSNGKVYVYHGMSSTETWSLFDSMEPQYAYLYNDTSFGADVAVFADRLVVGAPTGFTQNCTAWPRCGFATYWHYDADADAQNWLFGWKDAIETQDNAGGNPSGPQLGMGYGEAVSIGRAGAGESFMVAMGAPRSDGFTAGGSLAEEAGSVELRVPTSGLTVHLGELRPALGSFSLNFAHFGASLDFGSEYRLAVGAPEAGSFFTGADGAVYIYGRERIFADGFDTQDLPDL